MRITADTRVADIATEMPASLDVFERYGVDFCCGGDRSLQEAARSTGLSVGDLITEIEQAESAEQEEDSLHEDWARYSPAGLLDHIVAAHHEYLRRELPRLGDRLAKVIQVHGDRHHELFELGRVFQRLRDELLAHLAREEEQVFPVIRAAFPQERYEATGTSDPALVGWLEDLEAEHDVAGDLLHQMRDITGGYAVPEDACNTYSALYRGLRELEADVHRHVHLENNILIPALREALEQPPTQANIG